MAIDDNTSYELTGYQVKDLAQKIRSKAEASSLASVATSGLYSDLTGAPTIPTVYNGTLTIQQNGTTIGTFSANQDTNETVNITGGGGTSVTKFYYTSAGGWIPTSSTSNVALYMDSAGTTAATGQQVLDAFMNGGAIIVGYDTFEDKENESYCLATHWFLSHPSPTPQSNCFTLEPKGTTTDLKGMYIDYPSLSGTTCNFGLKYNVQGKLSAGSNIRISGTTISATDTTYSAFTGTDGQTAGAAGLVPAPATTDAGKFLKSDGTWATAGGGGGGVVSFIATDMISMKYPAIIQWMQQHSLNPSTIQSLNFSPSGGTFVLLNDAGTELAPVDAISEAFMQGSRILIKTMFMQYGGQMIQTASYNGSVLAADVITSTSTNYPFVFAFSQENIASQASTFSCKKQAQIGTYNNKTYATFQVAKSS